MFEPEASIETAPAAPFTTETERRPPCPPPANFCKEVESYDASARAGQWAGPRYEMTYRILGEGPPLILVPGIASTYRCYALLLNRLSARFKTILYDYPGEHARDGARLAKITHDHLVDDLFGLIEHLRLGRIFTLGISFGSTVALKALAREPRRFPRASLQGAFAYRRFTPAEKLALRFGRIVPGTLSRLPLRRPVLEWNSKPEFPAIIADRWDHYVDQNGLTPIGPLAHRVDLLSRLDLRPLLHTIPVETLLLQGNEDRIVPRRYFDELMKELPHATGVVMPLVGHQPHYTAAESMATAVSEFLLPCAPGGCPNEAQPGRL
jgi:pimeloyl-ACP methyl ester carboxylesterase